MSSQTPITTNDPDHDASRDMKDRPSLQDQDLDGDSLISPEQDASDPLNSAADGPVKFESAEHAAIADNLILYKLDGKTMSAKDHNLITKMKVWESSVVWAKSKEIDLTFGMIIALAGDFFTNPGKGFPDNKFLNTFFSPTWEPISGPNQRGSPPPSWMQCCESFKNLIKALRSDYGWTLYSLIPLLEKERTKLRETETTDPTKAAQVYHSHDGLPSDADFIKATAGFTAITGIYGAIAFVNFDHFGSDAVTSYTAGHFYALQLARDAKQQGNDEARSKGLNAAYFADAAACHYLTDLFSSGHHRAPRRAFHTDDWERLATGNVADAAAGTDTTNVWDGMCRVMHDDDSSTGLVVRNKQGDFWTAFGDKQFFMPTNAVNRARCIQCVQKSIDEVFNVGYNGTGKLDESSAASFEALALLPLPYAALQNDQAKSVEKFNTAPLWLAETDEVKTSQKFLSRKDPGDHSDYTTLEGPPDFAPATLLHPASENETCANIAQNSFRHNDQFPDLSPFSIRGTGILQLVLTGPTGNNKSVGLSVNSYESIEAMNFACLTVRNQERQLTTFENDKLSSIIYACTYTDGSSTPASPATYILLFRAKGLVKSGQPSASQWTIFVATWKIVDENIRGPNSPLSFDFNRTVQPRLNLSKTMEWTPLFTTVEVANPTASSFGEQCGQLRFFVAKILPTSAQDKTLVPSIVSCRTIGHSKPGNLEVSTAKLAADMKSLTAFPTQRLAIETGFDTRILSLRNWSSNGPQPRFIFTCSDVAGSGYRFGTVQFTSPEAAQIELGKKTYLSAGTTTVSKNSSKWSWMTENRQSGSSNMITIDHSVTWPKFSLSFERSLDGSPNFSDAAEQHQCQQDNAQASEFVCPLFNAIYPEAKPKSTGTDTPSISTIINVFYVRKNGKIMTAFREHRRSSPQNNPAASTWTCTTSYVADDFATQARTSAGYYYPIKWMSVQHPGLNPDVDGQAATAIVQVFSYYGCVGYRLYGRKKASDSEIVMLGQQCYNGQPSLGIGCTVDALFGGEFLAYKARAFADYRQYQVPRTTSGGTSDAWVDYWGGGSDGKPLGLLPSEMPDAASKGKGWRFPVTSL